MARRILTDELIEKYKAREIDRRKLSEMLGRTEAELGVMFAKIKIKLWDKKIKTHNEVEYICKLYRTKKFTRDQLSKKCGINYWNLTKALIYRGIPLWDAKRKKRAVKREKSSRYYDWREFKNHIMMNYNQ